jgi:hypothetical protein
MDRTKLQDSGIEMGWMEPEQIQPKHTQIAGKSVQLCFIPALIFFNMSIVDSIM